MKLILLVLTTLFFSLAIKSIIADDFSSYEATCKEIGFKPKTPDFGDCVLELRRRDLSKKAPREALSHSALSNELISNKSSKSDYEAQANEYFRQQQALYDQQMIVYQKQKADVEAQQAAIEQAKDERRNMKLIELGLRMAGGQSVQDASMAAAGMQPLPTPRPPSMQMLENYRITTPNGGLVNCRYDPNIRSATCY